MGKPRSSCRTHKKLLMVHGKINGSVFTSIYHVVLAALPVCVCSHVPWIEDTLWTTQYSKDWLPFCFPWGQYTKQEKGDDVDLCLATSVQQSLGYIVCSINVEEEEKPLVLQANEQQAEWSRIISVLYFVWSLSESVNGVSGIFNTNLH